MIMVETIVVGRGAGIARFPHPPVESGAEFFLFRRELWVLGDVFNFIRIVLQIVKFFRRPFVETEFEKLLKLRVVAMFQDKIFRRRTVAIAKRSYGLPHFRIASGPAVGTEIAN